MQGLGWANPLRKFWIWKATGYKALLQKDPPNETSDWPPVQPARVCVECEDVTHCSSGSSMVTSVTDNQKEFVKKHVARRHIWVKVFILIDSITDMVLELHCFCCCCFSFQHKADARILCCTFPDVLLPTDLWPPTSDSECQYLAQCFPFVPSVSQYNIRLHLPN